MGTQVHYKGYMRDLSEDSNSSNWPLFYGDKTFTNGQYCNGFMSRTKTDAYPGYNKDVLKEKMLEHESIFKNQVVELHRLHRIQRDMMDEVKREELYKLRTSMDPSSSSSHLGSQVPSEDARKWHIGCARTSKSGTEVVNSPLSFSKGNGGQFGQCQLQNGCSSNICEVLEVRPSKVRKKLFDLELPADAYIDTDSGEQLQANGGSSNPSYLVNGNYTVAQESSAKLFSNCGKNASTSNTCLRSSNLLADLNEPAQPEVAPPSPVDFLGYGNNHRESRGLKASAKSNPAFLASPRETTWNFHHANPNGSLNSLYVDSIGKERDWFSSAYQTGSFAPVPQSHEQEKFPTPSRSVQVMLNKAYQPPGIHPFHRTRDDLWKQRAVHSLETFHINREPNYTHVEPLANSWSRTVCSWGKPSGDFTQRPSFVQTNPSLLSSSVSKSGQAPQSHDFFGDKWHISDSSRLNRFDHGSSSASKVSPVCFPSVAFDSLDCAKVETTLTSERLSTNGFQKILNSTNNMNSASEKGFDLNLLSQSSPSECDIELVEKCETNTLKNASSLEDCNTRATKEVGETRSIGKILGVPILENSLASKTELSSLVSTSVTLQSSPEGENSRLERRRKMLIDINMPCDLSITDEPEKPAAIEPLVPEKVMEETKVNNIRNCFDLNSCITEDEHPFSVEINNNVSVKKVVLEIDLEAPFVLDDEQTNMPEEGDKQHEEFSQSVEDKSEQRQDEVDRIAAEAIVAMSSSSQCIRVEDASCDPSDDPLESLRWFVDVVSSCAENGPGREALGKDAEIVANSTAKELDYFEAMTLQLTETKEEDYMPKPFVPEFQKLEDAGATSLTNRPRRGPARRGRQRRDFQRDILPGLVSLSRHEVTEDLQTFGGLMRATGHPWSSGLTRRTGGRNGRSRRTAIPISPPLLHQLNNIEASLEDKSLTGWGKTTRRPRRQRCPAGNPPVPLT